MHYGTLKVEYFAPKWIDRQTANRQGRIYVIASGVSRFYRAGAHIECRKGDVLFVPAGMEDRFEDFSDDFTTWVSFYGRDGEEFDK